MGRPTHPALDRSRVTELYAFDEQICSLVASGLVPNGQYPSSKAPTAEHYFNKKGFLCELCGERKGTAQASCSETKLLKIAGFDEAGRGALAGPVVVGCVHFPPVLFTAEDAKTAESSYRGKDLSDLCGGLKGTRGLRSGSILHSLVGLDDSKRLSLQKREELYEKIYTLAKWGIGCAPPSEIDRLGIVPALTLAAKRAYWAMAHSVDLLLLDRGLSLRGRRQQAATPRPSVKGLVLNGQRLSSKASTAEHAKDAEHPHKKERFLCELGDLCGEMKRPSLARSDATEWPFEIAFTKGDMKSLHIAAASILAKVSHDQMMARVHVRFPGYGFDHNKGYGTPGHFAALRRLGPSSIHRISFRLG